MPLGKNVRYRFKKTKSGYTRLAFKGNKVIEATPYSGKKGSLKKGESHLTEKASKKKKMGE